MMRRTMAKRDGIDRITLTLPDGREVSGDGDMLDRALDAVKKGRFPMGRKTAKDIPVVPAGSVEKTSVPGPDGTAQRLIPGTGPIVDERMDGLVLELVAVTDTLRKAKGQKETAEAAIMAEMKARKLRCYEASDGTVVTYESREKIKLQVPDES